MRVKDWHLAPGDVDGDGLGGVVETLVEWCRHTLAGCRRPYGIDDFDLTLAFRSELDREPRSLSFARLKPIELYLETFPQRLLATLSEDLPQVRPAALHLSAALFSWGEATHGALAAEG